MTSERRATHEAMVRGSKGTCHVGWLMCQYSHQNWFSKPAKSANMVLHVVKR
uniref:Uncharacterized protein n=1 Tax=Setaria italica TaxID=4555 RepID=K3ZBT3_SETIT